MKTTPLPLNLLLLGLLITTAFYINAHAQVAIPLSEINQEIKIGESSGFKTINEKVFISTTKGLFIINKDGTQFKKIDGIVSTIFDVEIVDGQTFIVETLYPVASNLWIINRNEDKAEKLEAIREVITGIERLGEQVFVGTRTGLFTVHKDTHRVEKVSDIAGNITQIKVVDEQVFVGTALNAEQGELWIVSKDGKKVEKVKDVEGAVDIIKAVGESVFVSTSSTSYEGTVNIYLLSKDGRKIEKLEEITQGYRITHVELVEDRLFIGLDADRSYSGAKLWTVSKNGGGREEVKAIEENIRLIKVIGEQVFVATEIERPRGTGTIWAVSKDGKNVEKVRDTQGSVDAIEMVGGQILISTDSTAGGDLWILSKDRKQIYSSLKFEGTSSGIEKVGEYVWIRTRKEHYIIYPNVEIRAELVESSWLTSLLDTILPYNLISMGEHEIRASYVDENGKDPFRGTVNRKFRFIKDEKSTKPAHIDFSQQDDFRYQINWGKNEVKYWVIDYWGNTLTPVPKVYYGVPGQYSFLVSPIILSVIFVLGCFALAPKVGFAHSAIMNPWLRKYFSLGSVPLLLSVSPALRRYILRRYSDSVSKDREFTEWKERFVYPDETFMPENFGKRLEGERRLLFTGQSGIGKTSFFKHLTACYVSKDRPKHPAKVYPVYISLTNYGGNSLEELVYTQLFSYGKITDRELAPMFLEQGGLLIFLDGVNEVQNVADRQKLSEFVEKFWTSNYICLSSQQSYPEIENIPKVELKAFGPEKVREFISQRVSDKERAERVIKSLREEDYQLYSVPRDLEFAVEILNNGASSLPRSRTELYKIIFSSIFDRWKQNGNMDAEDILCERAYRMIVEREMAFDSAESPKFKEISEDLFKQKFLVKREGSYNFRHDLIRAYLASEFFYPRWENLFGELDGKPIDSNWLEMLKFSCENISHPTEVKSLVYQVLEKSVRRDLVKSLFRWLKDNHPARCSSWEKDFYTKYGESDFK